MIISDEKGNQEVILFTQDDLIYPDVISIRKGGSIKEEKILKPSQIN